MEKFRSEIPGLSEISKETGERNMGMKLLHASCVDAGFEQKGFAFVPREIARYHVEIWYWTPGKGDRVWRVIKSDFYFDEPEKVMLFDSFGEAFKKFLELGAATKPVEKSKFI